MNTEVNANTATDTNKNDPFASFTWDEGTTGVVTVHPDDVPEVEEPEVGEVIDKAKPKAKTTEVEEEENGDDPFSAFAEEDETPKAPAKVKAVPATKVEKAAPAKTTKEDPEAGDDPEEEDLETGGEDEDTKFFTNLATEMKEKGIFSSVEIKKDAKITEDQFFDLQEEEVEGRANEIVADLITELKEDPTASALLKYVKEGGDSKEFFKVYKDAASNHFPEDYDLTKPANQEDFLRFYLKNFEEMDAEEIAAKLEWYAERGTTETTATKYHEKVLVKETKVKENLLKSQLKVVEANKEKATLFKTTLQKTLDETDTIGDYTFTPQEKKTLVGLITKPTIKVGDGSYITPFQAKMGEIMKDPKKLLILLKNVANDFDTKDLKKKSDTAAVATVKSTLRQSKTDKNLNNKGAAKRLSLADHF